MKLKLNDIYKFSYSLEWIKKNKTRDLNWCFDGQLIVKENYDGRLYLEDTYWSGSCENKSFTLKEALERGELTFVCNLDDVESIEKRDLDYYADEDLFDLSRQHGCYKEYYKRKGAKRSTDKMKQVLLNKIEDTEHEIKSKENTLERLKNNLVKLENGDTSIYIW